MQQIKSKARKRKHYLPEWAEAHGLKNADLIEATGADKSRVSRWMNKDVRSEPGQEYLDLLAARFEVSVDRLYAPPGSNAHSRPTTKIVGRAGASTDGRIEFVTAEGGIGEVEIPEGATEDSVAIEIEGYSQGFIADGCLIFYTEVHAAPTEDMLGTIVVVGTDDGEVLLKKLLRGSLPGHYDLESINGPMLKDRRVVWAAHVDSLVPPWRAKRLRVDASEIKL